MACGLKIKNDWIEWLLNEWLINWSRSHFGLCFGETSVFEMNNGRAVGRKTCHDIGRASLWKETPLVVEGILISLFHIQMPIRKEPGSMWIEPGFNFNGCEEVLLLWELMSGLTARTNCNWSWLWVYLLQSLLANSSCNYTFAMIAEWCKWSHFSCDMAVMSGVQLC